MPRFRFSTATALVVLAALLASCGDYPQLNARVTDRAKAADYPEIVPLGPLLAQVPPISDDDYGIGTLATRAAALRARAARMHGQIVDPTTRARMQAALARHN